MARPADRPTVTPPLPVARARAARRSLAALCVLLWLAAIGGWLAAGPLRAGPAPSSSTPAVAPVAQGPGVLLDLVVPGALSSAPAQIAAGLPASGLAPRLYVGQALWLLALVTLAGVGGSARVAQAGLLLATLALCLHLPSLSRPAAFALPLVLAAAGALGLFRLGLAGAGEERGWPALVCAVAAVTVAAATALAALQAGALTDEALLSAVLRHAPPDAPAELLALHASPEGAAHFAPRLRLAADRAALTCFAILCVMLVHLHRRRLWSAGLLVLVAGADAWVSMASGTG